MKITREDFDLWLANPVTDAMRRTCEHNAVDNKEQWIAISWHGGVSDPVQLAEMRARAETAQDLSEFEFDDLLEELRDDGKQERNRADRIQGLDQPD